MKNLFFLSLIFLVVKVSIAQNNVGIGTTNPNSNAILDIHNGNQNLGLLLPKVDVTGFTPAAGDYGMFVYDTLQNQIFYWNGASWNGVSPGWTLFGNSGTDSLINFIGTTDPQALVFKTNNITRMQIQRTGNIGMNGFPSLNDKLYVFRSATVGPNDFGPNQSNIHAYRNGSNIEPNGGIGWAYSEIDAAIKGTSFWGNNFSAGVAGYNYNDYANSASVIGSQYNGAYWGALGFRDSLLQEWGVYSATNSYTGGNSQIEGQVGIGSIPFSNVKLNIESNYIGAAPDYGIFVTSSNNQNAKIGVYAQLDSVSTGNRLTGIDALLNPVGTNNEAIGLKSYIQPTGTGYRKGVDVIVLSSATSTGPFYGGAFSVQNESAGGTSYGIYTNTYGSSANRYGIYTVNEAYNYHSGNLGIGNPVPQYPLHIFSPSSFTADFGSAVIYGNSNFQSNAMVLEGNSTGSPGAPFIYSNAYLTGYAPNPTGTNNYGVWGHQPGTGVGGYGIIASNGPNKTSPNRYVALAGSTYAGIFMGGNVGINTATPNSQLQFIQTDAIIGGSSAIRYYWGANYWRTFHSGAHYSFEENGVRRAYVEAGSGNYVQPSDATLKKNITEIPSILSKVNQLNAVTYHYNDVSSDRAKTIGFLAQEVEQIFPEIVRTAEDGTKALSYTDFSILAIKAIQEQQKQIEELQKEILLLKESR